MPSLGSNSKIIISCSSCSFFSYWKYTAEVVEYFMLLGLSLYLLGETVRGIKHNTP